MIRDFTAAQARELRDQSHENFINGVLDEIEKAATKGGSYYNFHITKVQNGYTGEKIDNALSALSIALKPLEDLGFKVKINENDVEVSWY